MAVGQQVEGERLVGVVEDRDGVIKNRSGLSVKFLLK